MRESKNKFSLNKKKLIIFGLLYIGLLLAIWYFGLPFINFRSKGFYYYLLLILILPLAFLIAMIRKKKHKTSSADDTYVTFRYNKQKRQFVKTNLPLENKYILSNLMARSSLIIVGVFLILMLIFDLSGAKLFHAKAYAKQLEITTGNSEDLNTIFDYESGGVLLPKIDKALAFKLAEARLEEYGSQYSIDYDNFTLISVNRNNTTELLRVTPLEYATPFVALSRGGQGTIGYIEVNVITQEAKLVDCAAANNGGLKYMPSGIFKYDLDRHIRMHYPTLMYNTKYFEIDNDGNPYWVIPTIKKEIGMFAGATPKGVLIVNPQNGDMNYYKLDDENKPDWIQRVIDEDVVASQANNALTYKNGFWNKLFAKKEVFQLSDGYNYFIKDGNTYYVSCITSPNLNDQTSIGFLIINLRTKESIRYSSPGITEMRAREIAQNDERVKAQALDSTWPILITYHNVPTYFVVLKNEVLSQKYVLINVDDGTLVAMGDDIDKAKQEYDSLLANKGIINPDDNLKITAVVKAVRDLGDKIQFMIEGNNEEYFEVDVNLNLDARFLKVGDEIEITYKKGNNYNLVLELKKKG